MARDGATRAANLTKRLLAFSRQQALAPTPVDANKLVAGMSDLLRRTLGATIKLETVLGGGLWLTHVDANQLESAILNLAVNARDAMRRGRPASPSRPPTTCWTKAMRASTATCRPASMC